MNILGYVKDRILFISVIIGYCIVAPIHELSHYLGCIITKTKVYEFHPFQPVKLPNGLYRLGLVKIEDKDMTLESAIIISFAPLLLNTIEGLILIGLFSYPLQSLVFDLAKNRHFLLLIPITIFTILIISWGLISFEASIPSDADFTLVNLVYNRARANPKRGLFGKLLNILTRAIAIIIIKGVYSLIILIITILYLSH